MRMGIPGICPTLRHDEMRSFSTNPNMDRDFVRRYRGRSALVLLPEKKLHLRAHSLYLSDYLRSLDDGDLLLREAIPFHHHTFHCNDLVLGNAFIAFTNLNTHLLSTTACVTPMHLYVLMLGFG